MFYIGLADENESVREAALSAGHVLVEHYATTYVHFLIMLMLLMQLAKILLIIIISLQIQDPLSIGL